MKFLNFFLFLLVIFALLDPDSEYESGSTGPIESGSNSDPDPQPWCWPIREDHMDPEHCLTAYHSQAVDKFLVPNSQGLRILLHD